MDGMAIFAIKPSTDSGCGTCSCWVIWSKPLRIQHVWQVHYFYIQLICSFIGEVTCCAV